MIPKKTVIKYLDSKDAVNKCEDCGSLSWTVPSNEKEKDLSITCNLSIAHAEEGMYLPPPAVATTVTVCTNCGHVRLFASIMIIRESE